VVPLDSCESSGSRSVCSGESKSSIVEGELGIWDLQPLLPEAGWSSLVSDSAWKWPGEAALQVVEGRLLLVQAFSLEADIASGQLY